MKSNQTFTRIVSFFCIAFLFVALPALITAQTPTLKHVFDIRAKIGQSINEGTDADGRLKVTIPITGGEVTGDLNAIILPGGADHQLVDTIRKTNTLRAVYDILTPDSTIIRVTNEGINLFAPNTYYFVTTPTFELLLPQPSSERTTPYDWLTERIFVCRPINFGNAEITLRVWQID